MTTIAENGNVLITTAPPSYFSHFSLCRWPAKSNDFCLLYASEKAIYLLSPDGRVVCNLDAPYSSQSIATIGTAVKLIKGKPDYFAVMATPLMFKRSLLYVYDSTGKLVYQEVMPVQGAALTAGPSGSIGTQALYLGGEGEVLKYIAH